MHKIIREISKNCFVIEIKTKFFEGRRLATQEDLNSGKTLMLFYEDNYKDLVGR